MKRQSIRIFLTLLAICIISMGMLSCGSNDDDLTYKPITPTDPSEPIVVATLDPIDFEAEKKEIQGVYSAFYSAFNRRKISDIRKLWKDHPLHAEFRTAWVMAGEVESVGPITGWSQIKSAIESLWSAPDTAGDSWVGNNQFRQFWIRRTKADPNSLEASARTFASFKHQSFGITSAYLIKNEHENWHLQQIDSVTGDVLNKGRGAPEISRYFTDESAMVP